MTLDDFRNRSFHNILSARTVDDVYIILATAESVFRQSGTSISDQRSFWILLNQDLSNHRNEIFERQSATALSAIIAAAQAAIAARISGK